MRAYVRSLITTVVITGWFFPWMFFLGYWGYLVAIPTTAAYFAFLETW